MAPELLEIIFALAIVIIAAKIGGAISVRLGQPSVLGELLAGVILGPTVLDILHFAPLFQFAEETGEALKMMAELGVIILMLLAGLELDLEDLLKSGVVSSVAGTLGVIVPIALGYGVSILFGLQPVSALFMGLALAATSVSISAQTLMELNALRSRVGLALLGAAVFDDILVILLLSVTIALVGGAGGGLGAVGVTMLGMVAYLVLAVAVGLRLIPSLMNFVDRLPVSRGVLAFTLVACLFYAWSAEILGSMAAITGAFIVGLFIGRTPFRAQIVESISSIAYGFFVPIFFVNIGLEADMLSIGSSGLWFALAITAVAIVSKIIGCGSGALLGGFSPKEALQLGVGMVSRGEVGLIIAAYSLSTGYMDGGDYSVAIFMVIFATLVTPPMLRAVFKGDAVSPQEPAPRRQEVG